MIDMRWCNHIISIWVMARLSCVTTTGPTSLGTHRFTKVIDPHCSFNNAWRLLRTHMLIQCHDKPLIPGVNDHHQEIYMKLPLWYLSFTDAWWWTYSRLICVQASHFANRTTFNEHALHFSRLIPTNFWLKLFAKKIRLPWGSVSGGAVC